MKFLQRITVVFLIGAILVLQFSSCGANSEKELDIDEVASFIENEDWGDDVSVEKTETRYISKEYFEEYYYNNIDNYFLGYSASELKQYADDAWFFSCDNGKISIEVIDRGEWLSCPDHSNDKLIRNLLISGGITLVCVTLSVFGSPVVATIATTALKKTILSVSIKSVIAAGAERFTGGTWKETAQAAVETGAESFAVTAISKTAGTIIFG